MTPDYDRAATKAMEILIANGIHKAPIDPFPILKNYPGVFIVSFEEMSNALNVDRCDIIRSCKKSPDAITATRVDGDEVKYIIAFNRYLSMGILQKAFARELAHVVLGHNGSLPDEIRTAEAKCFAQHLLAPRPLIHVLQAFGIKISTHVLSSVTDCYDECVLCMRKLPATHVPAEMNRKVRDQFMKYILNYFEYQRIMMHRDETAVVDFGTYMDGYVE